MSAYRPWGKLDWALKCSNARKWKMLGCIGPEARSIEVPSAMHQRTILDENLLLRIRESGDPDAHITEALLRKSMDRCSVESIPINVVDHGLLDPLAYYASYCDDWEGASVMLDITSMPKRYFFYFLRKFLLSKKTVDLMITYCPPKAYFPGQLSGNYEDWDILSPPFRIADPIAEERARRRLILNVGFMVDGLQGHLSSDETKQKLDILLPFPAPPDAMRRAWKSVITMQREWPGSSPSVHRVDSRDTPGAFDQLVRLLPTDSNLVSLAPLGPKPISAAMAIFACLTGSPVYYAQPKWYSPHYSSGVSVDGNNNPIIYGYWIKHSGRDLYELPVGRSL